MAVDYSRIGRLLKILMLIQGQTGWSAARLAKECGVSVRMIYRDMKALEGAGIPYFHDRESGGYQVRRDFFLPPVQLTLDEALALSALAEHVAGAEQVAYLKPASKALAKVRGQLPASIRSELEQIEDHVAIKLASAMPPEGATDVYETVRHALSSRTALRCVYESVNAPVEPTKPSSGDSFVFKPYALLFNQRAWYTLGHHGGRREIRCLKLTRFTHVRPTTETYDIPKNFTVTHHLGNAWRMIRGKPTYDIELHFEPEFADTISDTHWHATQEVTWNDDGSITFCCKVDGLEEIVWWILGMGPHCVVRKPKVLADLVKSKAMEMVRRYD